MVGKKTNITFRTFFLLCRLFFSFDFDPESCANPAAAAMWREDKEKFRSVAKNCVNQSRMEVYDEPEDADDPNVLR
ncbi:hypothetical protein OESDEN_12308 [Oesophagostomum dentatum]|uniref:UBC core domain-containing protein n=1 Tax=Oesophagostomum dentatum TaxID=61180 RepID=A0A0B1SSG5_OESDE|nr:hypothetical protein OESDEN_12308 [Oesophagostomum dentatum]